MARVGALLFCAGLLAEPAAGMRADLAAQSLGAPAPAPGTVVEITKDGTKIRITYSDKEFVIDAGNKEGERQASLPTNRSGETIDPDEPCELCPGRGFTCFDEPQVFGDLSVDFLEPDEAVNSFDIVAFGTACGDGTMSFNLSGYVVHQDCDNTQCKCGECKTCVGKYEREYDANYEPVPLANFDPNSNSVIKVFTGGEHYCTSHVKVILHLHKIEIVETADPTPAPSPAPSRTGTPRPTRDPNNPDVTPAPTRTPRPPPPPSDPSASGDPHVTSVAGERFDINAPGEHVMLRVPMDRSRPALLEVRGHIEADELARACGMYIRLVTLRGDWLGNGTVQVRPLKRDVPGSNDAGTAVIWPLSIRESKAATDGGNWKSAADLMSSGDGGVQVLSDSVTVAARQHAEEFGNGAAGQAFEFFIKGRFSSQASIVVSQGQRQSLNLKLKGLASLGERRLGGLLGTEPHDPQVEQKTRECMASKSRDGIEDMRMMEPDSSRISASA